MLLSANLTCPNRLKMVATTAVASFAMSSLLCGLAANRASLAAVMVFVEALWSLNLLIASDAALRSLSPAAMPIALLCLCFSAAEFSNAVLGLSSAQALASTS